MVDLFMESKERIEALKSALRERILVIDGAMGTAIQSFDLGADDFGGAEYEGCNENLVLTRPDVIESIHRGHLDAGADIIETNTFGSTAIVLSEYDLAHEARRLNRVAAELARRAADGAATPDKPRFVAGSMGPTTKTISVTGGVTFEELADSYHVQAAGLMEGGVDVLLLETGQDTLNIKAGLEGIDRAFRRAWLARFRWRCKVRSSPWAPCWQARTWRRSTCRWRTAICCGSASIALPALPL